MKDPLRLAHCEVKTAVRLVRLYLVSVLCRRTAIVFFKTAGEIPLVAVSRLGSHILNLIGFILQKLPRPLHPSAYQILHKAFPCDLLEDLAHIIVAEIEHGGSRLQIKFLIAQVLFNQFLYLKYDTVPLFFIDRRKFLTAF